MNRQMFTAVLLLNVLFSFAQHDNNDASLHPLTKLDLGLQGAGLTFERKLGRSTAIDLSGGLGGGYEISSNSFDYHLTRQGISGYLSINPKFYYGRTKRIAKGKSGLLNAGNYIGLRIKYTTRSIAENGDAWDALLFNVHWGMQRDIAKRWTMNAHFGAGYAIDATDLNNSSGTFYPALELKVSYVLNKQRG